LLGLNTLLVNRDDALFDNLPWSTWTVDPAQRNRDAAGNALNKLFHFGKRDAYNRFMGKDWHGESLAMGNLALRLESSIAAASAETDDPSSGNPQQPSDEAASLAKRILELQIRELEMDSVECDYQLAVSRTNSPDQVEILQSTKEACLNQLEISQRRQSLLVILLHGFRAFLMVLSVVGRLTPKRIRPRTAVPRATHLCWRAGGTTQIITSDHTRAPRTL
jgi:hypothetical protein